MGGPASALRKRREIAHGARIASRADVVWQRHTRSGQQRVVNRFQDFVGFVTPGPAGRLLEIGCGTAVWTRHLAQLPVTVISIDISDHLIRAARDAVRNPAVRFTVADCEQLPFQDAQFQYVCGLSVLHHTDAMRTIKEAYRVLKPGGKAWFSEPNMLNPQVMLQKHVPFIKRWLGDTPDETAFFKRQLHRYFAEARFASVQVWPFDFLHPLVPAALTSTIDRVGKVMETLPLAREIAGSLLVHAQK